jgi:hypothetical protein
MAKMQRSQTLANNVSGTDVTTGVLIESQGGRMIVVSGATIGTVQIEVEASDGSFVPIIDGSFTEASAKYMQGIISGMTIRVSYTGSTGVTVEISS